MKPSVGRIVHYVPPGGHDGECMAAIVTFVGYRDRPALSVFWPPLVMHQPQDSLVGVVQDEARTNHVDATWHWPERVGES